ncbi:helix-turn-helix transcriptional regulator [Veillonella sp.]|uniref:helix-turn-helix domain-containing protein n=1 Tax=Veillonella sp. TaxID=1926307 RepID=UPI0025FC7BB4|nr:helix-turn-helix transcriptional regulator [Veillonella sp.]
MNEFRESLVKARKAAGLSQIQTARLLEMSYRNYNDWERGITSPPSYAQRAVLYCLDYIRADLFAHDLKSVIDGGLDPREFITVTRDADGQIINWSFERQSGQERMPIGEVLDELMSRKPYLSKSEIESLRPGD